MPFNFDFTYYQENILVVGAVGSGKTTFVKKLLDTLSNTHKWIFDVQGNYSGYGKIINDYKLIKTSEESYIIDSPDKSFKYFDSYMKYEIDNARVWNISNIINVVDELQLYTNAHDYTSNLMTVVTSLRNRGISNIFITPSPALLPSWIKENTVHFFAFRTEGYNHIEYMEKNFFGDKAWLLTSPDKRKKLQTEPMLEKYSYIYRNAKQAETIVITPKSI